MTYRYFSLVLLFCLLFSLTSFGQDKVTPPEILPSVNDLKGFPADEKAYLTWTPFDTDTLDGYKIYRNISAIFDTNVVLVDSVGIDVSSYIDSGLDNWTPYSEYYKLGVSGEYYYWIRTVQGDLETSSFEPILVRPMPRTDEFGYTWSSNMDLEGETPVYDWVDIKDTGTRLNLTGLDDVVGPIALGFEFPFYEWYFDGFYPNTHGMASFTTATTQYWPPAFPYDEFFSDPVKVLDFTSSRTRDKFNVGDSDPMATLAVHWMDSNFDEDTLAYFWTDGEKAILQYDRIPHYSELDKQADSDTSTYQIIFYANGDFEYVYKEVGDYLYTFPASVGWQNHAGTDGLNIMYDTDGVIRDEMIVHVKNNYIAPTDAVPNVYVSDFGDGNGGIDKDLPEGGYYAGKITEMRWDGADARMRIKGEVNSPNVLAIDYHNQKMYFADSPGGLDYAFNNPPVKAVANGNGIYRSNLDGTNVEALFVDTTGFSVPSDIKLDLKNNQIYWSEQMMGAFIRYDLGTSEMDTLRISFPDAKIGLMPLAFEIDFNTRTIFWSDFYSEGSIFKAHLDTLEAELVFEYQYCTDLEIDPGYNALMWINSNAASVGKSVEGWSSTAPTELTKKMYYSSINFVDLDSLKNYEESLIPADFMVTRMNLASAERKILLMGTVENAPSVPAKDDLSKSIMTRYNGYVGIWEEGTQEVIIIKDGMEWMAGGAFNLPPSLEGLIAIAEVGRNELTWDPAENAVGYNVYRGTASYPTEIYDKVYTTPSKIAAVHYVDDDVEGGTTYYYRVAEFTADQFVGNYSAQDTATTLLVPKVDLSTEMIDFGGVEKDSSETTKFVIYSTGADDLIISSIGLGAAEFSLIDLAMLPDTLAPGDTLAVTVQFLPTETGNFTDSVFVVTNAAYPEADTLLTIKLVGEGTPPTGISDESGIPTEFAVKGNYPNPFNPSTNIRVDIPMSGRLDITIYNVLGQVVNRLYNGQISAGRHAIRWNGKNITGQQTGSGVYFYRVKYGNKQFFNKMTLLK